jgi:ferrochelatase
MWSRRMVKAGCDKILFFPLYPQYAGATSATANDQFFRALMTQKCASPPRARCRPISTAPIISPRWPHRSPRLGNSQPKKLVASYHGMPKRYLMEGDPYHCQCQKTSRLLREALGWDEGVIDTTFQSVFGTEEWLRPYTVQHVAELAKQGITEIAVISPAFSPPIASRRWRRSTARSARPSSMPAARNSPISPA